MPEAAKTQHVPRRAASIVMYLFLGSLAMLFLASMLGYVLIRVTNDSPGETIKLPKALWVSTVMMLAASYTMERALRAIRREKQALFRIYLSATVAFAAIFVAIQTPAMVQLYHEHEIARADFEEQRANRAPARPDSSINRDEMIVGHRSMPFYGLIMVLILIHALHVVGGMVSLGVVAWQGYHGRYDHEHYTGVSHCVMYWHFLDGVWIVMFVVISAFG